MAPGGSAVENAPDISRPGHNQATTQQPHGVRDTGAHDPPRE